MLAAFLRQQGHEVYLIHFKSFQTPFILRSDVEKNQLARNSPCKTVEQVHGGGVYYCPYPTPITETEKELLIERLKALRPQLIGFSVNYFNSPVAQELTTLIKSRIPGTRVIWGGIHPTSCPEESIQYADAICIGEGDLALLDLLNHPESTEIKNFWFRLPGGEVVKNPLRPLIQNLDSLPFADYGVQEEQIENDKLSKLTLKTHRSFLCSRLVISTQRGCPFACSYCLHHVVRNLYHGQAYVRRRSVDNVLAEIELRIKQFGLPVVSFWDDVFLINSKWIDEFCQKYPRRFKIPFGGYSYPTVTTEEMVRKLRQAGMVFLSIGVQTGSEYIGREIYKRNYSNEKILELAGWGEKYGLELAYDVLSNNPYEREEDCRDTLKLLLTMPRPVKLAIKKLRIFPNTSIEKLEHPRINLSEEVFDYWNSLYLLTKEKRLSREMVWWLANNQELRLQPQILINLVDALCKTSDENEYLQLQLNYTQQDFSASNVWRYIKGYLRANLPTPIYQLLKSLYSPLKKSK